MQLGNKPLSVTPKNIIVANKPSKLWTIPINVKTIPHVKIYKGNVLEGPKRLVKKLPRISKAT